MQLLWNMFKETGRINAYIFYKELEQEGLSDGDETDILSVSVGNSATGQGSPLEGQV